jgi:hypothetical protein
MKVKKNLSIDDDLLKKAEYRAQSLHLCFSAYIITLINRDIEDKDKYIEIIRRS